MAALFHSLWRGRPPGFALAGCLAGVLTGGLSGCVSLRGDAIARASALARRELAEAQGDAGVAVVEELEPCLAMLESSFQDRMPGDDPVAEAVQRVLAGAGRLVTPGREDAGARRRVLLGDPSQARRLTMRSSRTVAAREDVSFLLDVARRDPDFDVRRHAIEALGYAHSREAVLGLTDLWAATAEREGIAIARAWGAIAAAEDVSTCDATSEAPACLAWRRLSHAAGQARGLASLEAALVLLGLAGDAPSDRRTAIGAALGFVEAAIDSGVAELRTAAIDRAPLRHPRLLEAVVGAAESSDPLIATAARARLAEGTSPVTPEEREGARSRLGEQASSPDPTIRRRVALAQARAGALTEALAFLADHEATVRSAAACAVMRGR